MDKVVNAFMIMAMIFITISMCLFVVMLATEIFGDDKRVSMPINPVVIERCK